MSIHLEEWQQIRVNELILFDRQPSGLYSVIGRVQEVTSNVAILVNCFQVAGTKYDWQRQLVEWTSRPFSKKPGELPNMRLQELSGQVTMVIDNVDRLWHLPADLDVSRWSADLDVSRWRDTQS